MSTALRTMSVLSPPLHLLSRATKMGTFANESRMMKMETKAKRKNSSMRSLTLFPERLNILFRFLCDNRGKALGEAVAVIVPGITLVQEHDNALVRGAADDPPRGLDGLGDGGIQVTVMPAAREFLVKVVDEALDFQAHFRQGDADDDRAQQLVAGEVQAFRDAAPCHGQQHGAEGRARVPEPREEIRELARSHPAVLADDFPRNQGGKERINTVKDLVAGKECHGVAGNHVHDLRDFLRDFLVFLEVATRVLGGNGWNDQVQAVFEREGGLVFLHHGALAWQAEGIRVHLQWKEGA